MLTFFVFCATLSFRGDFRIENKPNPFHLQAKLDNGTGAFVYHLQRHYSWVSEQITEINISLNSINVVCGSPLPHNPRSHIFRKDESSALLWLLAQ